MRQAFASGQKSGPGAAQANARGAPQRIAAPRGMSNHRVLQRKAGNTAQTEIVPPIVQEVLRSPGEPLDAATRNFMEPRFEQDFSGVRVHTDTRAGEAASSIDARAFTSNHSIAFGAGQYAPQTGTGRRLLAHELTHVAQQQAGVHLKDGLGQAGDSYEAHADAVADQIVSGRSAEGLLHRFTAGTRASPATQKATGTIQCQPALKKTKGPNTAKTLRSNANSKSTGKSQPARQASAIVSAGTRSREEILTTIRSLKAQLEAVPSNKKEYQSIARSVWLNEKALLDAPIEPTPKRDFISGPIHFTETYNTVFSPDKNPNFFSLTYKSLDDKAWEKSWMEFYKLATMEVGIVISICEAIFGEEDDGRYFDKSGKEKEHKGKAEDFIEEQGKDTPSHFLEHGVARPLERDAEKYGTKEAEVIAKGAKKLAFFIDAALTAYDIYEANTEGPSLHAAAVETTARIMGKAFNMARGINMVRGQGGEFIQHSDHSEVRVARNPLDRTPLPQMNNRRLAYDMVGNRVYEMMINVLAPKHLKSAEAFTAFRNARMENAENIVDNAGANIIDESKKFGGKMVLVSGRNVGGKRSYVVEVGHVDGADAAGFVPNHAFYEILAHDIVYRNDLDSKYLYRAAYSSKATKPNAAKQASSGDTDVNEETPSGPTDLGDNFAIASNKPAAPAPNAPLYYEAHNMVGSDQFNKAHGLAAYFLIPKNRRDAPGILAFRGTEPALADILADANKEGPGATSFSDLKLPIVKTFIPLKQAASKTVVTGHSLGGALAQLTTAAFPKLVNECVTFNSPGISQTAVGQFASKSKSLGVDPTISHYVTRGDIVSSAGRTRLPGKTTMFDGIATRNLEKLYAESAKLLLADWALSEVAKTINSMASDTESIFGTVADALAIYRKLKAAGALDALEEIGRVFDALHSDRLIPISVAIGNKPLAPIVVGNKKIEQTAWRSEPPTEQIGIPEVENARVLLGDALVAGLDTLFKKTLPVIIAQTLSPSSMAIFNPLVPLAKNVQGIIVVLVLAIKKIGGMTGLVGNLLHVDPKTGQIPYWLPEITVKAKKSK